MNRGYFVVLVLAIGAVVATVVMTGSGLAAFTDWPSLAVVLAFPVLMGFASHAPREIGRSFRVAFRAVGATRGELESALAYFDGLGRSLVCGGAFGVAVGLVAILGFAGIMRDAERVGRGLALCLLAAVYAIVLVAVVAIPFRTAVRRRIAELAE